MTYDPNYLAHSKGPWKKHKYIKKVGNRYYYAGSKGYYKALATTNDSNYTESEKRAAKKVNARNANAANLKRVSRKQRIKNVGVSARLKAQKAGNAAKRAGAAVADTADRFTNKSRRTATMRIAKRAVSGAASKASSAAKRAGAAVADTANRLTNKSRRTATMRVAKRAFDNSKAGKAARSVGYKAKTLKTAPKRTANKAKRLANFTRRKAKNLGRVAISSLMNKYNSYKSNKTKKKS